MDTAGAYTTVRLAPLLGPIGVGVAGGALLGNLLSPSSQDILDGIDPSDFPDAANDPSYGDDGTQCFDPDGEDPCKKKYLALKHLWLGIRDAVTKGLVTKAYAHQLANYYNKERDDFLKECGGWGSPPPMNPFNPGE